AICSRPSPFVFGWSPSLAPAKSSRSAFDLKSIGRALMFHLVRENLIYITLSSAILMSIGLGRLIWLALETTPLTFPPGGKRGERRRAACQSSIFRRLDPSL